MNARRRFLVLAMAGLATPWLATDSPAQNSPQHRNPRLVRGRFLIDSRRYKEAIDPLTRFLDRWPSNAEGWHWLGVAYRGTGQYQQSLDASRKALRFQRNHVGAVENMGHVYLAQRQTGQAREQLERLQRMCRFGCIQRTRLEQAFQRSGLR